MNTTTSNTKIVYFVRHGQSEGNVTPIFQSPSSPLSTQGKEQAEQIAKRVASLSFDVLIASPFLRAQQTAEAIAHKTGKSPEYSDLFVERIKPTSIYDKLRSDPEAKGVADAWSKSLYTLGEPVEDGENFNRIIARADAALEYLAQRKETTMVVVTHGYFLRTLASRIILGDMLSCAAFKKFQEIAAVENTSLSVFRYKPRHGWHLWIYNDHAHLAD